MFPINSATNLPNTVMNDFQKNNNCANPKPQPSTYDCPESKMPNFCPAEEVTKKPYNPSECTPQPKPYQGNSSYESYNCNPYAQMMKMKMQDKCKPQDCKPPETRPQDCKPPEIKPQDCKPQDCKPETKAEGPKTDKTKECNPNPVEKPYKELKEALKGLGKALDSLTNILNKESKILSKLENLTEKLEKLLSKLTGSNTPAPGTSTPTPGTGTPAPGTGAPTPNTETPAPIDGSIKEQLGQILTQLKSLISELENILKGEPKNGGIKPNPTPTPAPGKDVKEPGKDINQQVLNVALEALEVAVSLLKKFAKPDDGLVTIQNSNMLSKMQMKA